MSSQEKDIQRIHDALEAAKGNRAIAAELLGIEQDVLSKKIRNTDSLRERWVRKMSSEVPVTEAQAYVREAIIPPKPYAPESALVPNEPVSTHTGDQHFRNALKAMGLDFNDVQLAQNFQAFHNKHSGRVVDTMGGGMMRQSFRILKLIEDTQDRIEKGQKSGDFEGEEGIYREKMLRESLHAAMQEYRKVAEFAQTSALVREKINALKSERGGEMKRGKPGFAPLQAQKNDIVIHAAPGSTVITNESRSTDNGNSQQT